MIKLSTELTSFTNPHSTFTIFTLVKKSLRDCSLAAEITSQTLKKISNGARPEFRTEWSADCRIPPHVVSIWETLNTHKDNLLPLLRQHISGQGSVLPNPKIIRLNSSSDARGITEHCTRQVKLGIFPRIKQSLWGLLTVPIDSATLMCELSSERHTWSMRIACLQISPFSK